MNGKSLVSAYESFERALRTFKLRGHKKELAMKVGLHWMVSRADILELKNAENINAIIEESDDILREALLCISQSNIIIFDENRSEIHYRKNKNGSGSMYVNRLKTSIVWALSGKDKK